MDKIKNTLLDFKESFAKDQQNIDSEYSKFKSHAILTKELPNLLKQKACLNKEYKCEGSIGKGRLAKITWISIYDTKITKSAIRGYYIVYLFQNDLKGFYLSLNQGWTQYKNEFKTKRGKEKIRENKDKAQALLKGTHGFSFEKIYLHASGDLPNGYELGNICSKYYSFNSLPEDNELIDDLRNLIGIYRELKGLIGADILNFDSIKTETEFQQEIQKIRSKHDVKEGLLEKSEVGKVEHNIFSWNRNPQMSANAIIEAKYQCENNRTHQTFTSPISGKQFMEAHHLVPMRFQEEFNYSIDVPENIICLCPNCHRAFHFGSNSDKKELIKRFYTSRKSRLAKRGINLSLEELLKFYDL